MDSVQIEQVAPQEGMPPPAVPEMSWFMPSPEAAPHAQASTLTASEPAPSTVVTENVTDAVFEQMTPQEEGAQAEPVVPQEAMHAEQEAAGATAAPSVPASSSVAMEDVEGAQAEPIAQEKTTTSEPVPADAVVDAESADAEQEVAPPEGVPKSDAMVDAESARAEREVGATVAAPSSVAMEVECAQAEPTPAENVAPSEPAPDAGAINDADTAKAQPQVPGTDAAPSELPLGTGASATSKPPPPSAASKRKRNSEKGIPLDVMANKIKRLQQEAEVAEAAAAELETALNAKRAEVAAKHAEVQKASKDYVKKQCEAALAQLDAAVPKRPSNPFFLFSDDVRKSGQTAHLKTTERNKKITELWTNLSDQEKRKYKDHYEAENKKFKEWGSTEEGRRILRERNEVLRKCREAGKDELAEAVGSLVGSLDASAGAIVPFEPIQDMQSTPVKHSAEAIETPVKRRRSGAGKASEPALDEDVLQEASKADLLAQLRNLAGRPEVLALKKSSRELLDALKANSGIVNAAKRALIGA